MKNITTYGIGKGIFLSVLAFFFALTSCSKGPEVNPPVKVKTTTELITQKSWNWSSLEFKDQSGNAVPQNLTTGQTSAVYTFKPDGTFTITGNADGSTTTGTWKLIDNDTFQFIVNTASGPITQNFTVKVDEKTLVLASSDQFQYLDPKTSKVVTYYGKAATYNHN
jgi:hypothetical protein